MGHVLPEWTLLLTHSHGLFHLVLLLPDIVLFTPAPVALLLIFMLDAQLDEVMQGVLRRGRGAGCTLLNTGSFSLSVTSCCFV